MWHIAHEKVSLRDKRRSKNNFLPRSIFSTVIGLPTGIGILGRPKGGSLRTRIKSAFFPWRAEMATELVLYPVVSYPVLSSPAPMRMPSIFWALPEAEGEPSASGAFIMK